MVIVGSSTYAQLLVVLCAVASLSEAATHRIPFYYLEGHTLQFQLDHLRLQK